MRERAHGAVVNSRRFRDMDAAGERSADLHRCVFVCVCMYTCIYKVTPAWLFQCIAKRAFFYGSRISLSKDLVLTVSEVHVYIYTHTHTHTHTSNDLGLAASQVQHLFSSAAAGTAYQTKMHANAYICRFQKHAARGTWYRIINKNVRIIFICISKRYIQKELKNGSRQQVPDAAYTCVWACVCVCVCVRIMYAWKGTAWGNTV
jgi:hypothetical protein